MLAADKLKATRILELEDLKKGIEVEKKHSYEVFSIAKKVKSRHQKTQDDLKAAKLQVEEIEQALAAAKARVVELSQALEASRSEVNVTAEQVQITSALVLSLEDERKKNIRISPKVKRKSGLRIRHACIGTKLKRLRHWKTDLEDRRSPMSVHVILLCLFICL